MSPRAVSSTSCLLVLSRPNRPRITRLIRVLGNSSATAPRPRFPLRLPPRFASRNGRRRLETPSIRVGQHAWETFGWLRREARTGLRPPQEFHEIQVAHAVALASQRIQGEQVARPSVAYFRERRILALLGLRIRNCHRHLRVGALVAFADGEVALELADSPHANRTALRRQVREQRVLQ